MQQILFAIEQRLIFFSRRAGRLVFFGLIGAVLLLAGIGFLSVAVWVSLQAALGTVAAALILGVGLSVLGAGMFLLGTMLRRTPPPPPPVPAPSPGAAGLLVLIEAFIGGVRAARRGPKPRRDD